jgi:hypothetical protein
MKLLCYVCLLNPERFEIVEETRELLYLADDAVTTIGGTAVCRKHIKSIGNMDILAVNP